MLGTGLLWTGIIMVILGVIVLLPFFGTGMFTGGVGDVTLDIPISFGLMLLGSVFIALGGGFSLIQWISQQWHVFLLFAAGFAILNAEQVRRLAQLWN